MYGAMYPPVKERGDPGPLVLAVLHDGGLHDLVLRVPPDPALDHYSRHLQTLALKLDADSTRCKSSWFRQGSGSCAKMYNNYSPII